MDAIIIQLVLSYHIACQRYQVHLGLHLETSLHPPPIFLYYFQVILPRNGFPVRKALR